DMDGDGRPDVVVCGGDPVAGVVVLHNEGPEEGVLFNPKEYRVGGSPSRVAAGDVNGDGLPDLVVLDEATGEATLLLNSKAAPGTLTLPGIALPPFGPGCHDLVLADLDGDGLLDPMTLTADGALTFLNQGPRGTYTQ